MTAMRGIEKKARASYDDEALRGLTESDFRWMMIIDGCFFLQLALYVLGASKQLDYTDTHLIFGKNQSKKTLQGWIKSMFLVGNQIPLVVLNELMKQPFFQTVIKDLGQLERPTDMLSKQILYDLLLIPALESSKSKPSWKLLKKIKSKIYLPDQEEPTDLLHGLQLSLLGPEQSTNMLRRFRLILPGSGVSRTESSKNVREDELEDTDWEAGIEPKSQSKANRDLEAGRPAIKSESGANNNANEDRKKEDNEKKGEERKLCASNLQKKGIYIWSSKKAGSRGINFTNLILFGILSLPTLTVNHDIKVLFTNLKYYEITQQQKEVSSYLRFLSELISTYEDLNVLASSGIIHTEASDDKERFVEILRTVADKEMTSRHRSVIGRIKDYSVFPWERFKYVAIIVFFLSIAQTVFGVLSYFVGVKQLHQSGGRV